MKMKVFKEKLFSLKEYFALNKCSMIIVSTIHYRGMNKRKFLFLYENIFATT